MIADFGLWIVDFSFFNLDRSEYFPGAVGFSRPNAQAHDELKCQFIVAT